MLLFIGANHSADCIDSKRNKDRVKKAIMILVVDDTLALLDSTVDGIGGKDR